MLKSKDLPSFGGDWEPANSQKKGTGHDIRLLIGAECVLIMLKFIFFDKFA